jgi:hypothetical protein
VGNNPTWEVDTVNLPALPQMVLTITNRLQVYMIDGNNQLIDYVQFSGPDSSTNLNSIFQTPYSVKSYTNMWSTYPSIRGLPLGLANQIDVSDTAIAPILSYWGADQTLAEKQIDGFFYFMNGQTDTLPYKQFLNDSSVLAAGTNLVMQVPYTPTTTFYNYTTWQANDPLVHYLKRDLLYSGYDPYQETYIKSGNNLVGLNVNIPNWLPDIGQINARYEPWGVIGATANKTDVDTNKFNLAYKDPLTTSSDNWDFPVRKFPTTGWLGRVHRGTPWQTVYLKASSIDLNTWAQWTGDTESFTNPPTYFDASNSLPVQDNLLFDLFTTAPNENATSGQLSVNQNHLAAWSALFSGMVVLTNITVNPFLTIAPSNSWMFINPAGTNGLNSVLGNLVTNINNQRAISHTNLFSPGVFTHVGDILATPQLTEKSPFLNWNNPAQQLYGISDEVYEWLPQQMMGLVKLDSSPRFVLYCYGQALRPAQDGQLVSGTYSGMVTNYQVMAESAVRVVLRVDGATTQSPHIVVESYNLLPPD